MRGPRALAAGTLGAMLAWGCWTAAETASQDRIEHTRDELAAVERRMSELTRELNRSRASQAQEVGALRELELRIADLAPRLAALSKAAVEVSRRLEVLGEQHREAARDVADARRALARDAWAAYALAREGPLKLWLRQLEPDTVNRVLVLHRYVQRARARSVHRLSDAAGRLGEAATALEREAREREALAERVAASQRSLQTERARRRTLVASLGEQIRRDRLRMEELRADAERLKRLLEDLERELADFPMDLEGAEPFARLRGRLPWPVVGPVRRRFGTPRTEGHLKWQGVVIDAPAGSPVRAVAPGRVAYADWLRGFGLLLILEHGDGYLSLYGRNESLFKEVGDWVEAGEELGTVGATGGADATGLYFEIRHRRVPQNPARWLGPASGRAALVPSRHPPVS